MTLPGRGKKAMKSRSRRPILRRPRPSRPLGPWKHGKLPVVGVVGGIGSGKSTVASLFGELGAMVLDADKVGHALLNQRPVREEVVNRFGAEVVVIDEQGEEVVDRRTLGRIVFSDPAALRALESILHPRMKRTFERAIARTTRRGEFKGVILDAAILYEAEWNGVCDRIVFVDAPREHRLERVATSRGWTEDVLARREAAQAPLDEKRTRADFVVENSGDLVSLKQQVVQTWKKILASRPMPRVAPNPPRPGTRVNTPNQPRPRPEE
ncbi:MAG: dephospho-CoA kinase [Isosphaeraceae bacterium]